MTSCSHGSSSSSDSTLPGGRSASGSARIALTGGNGIAGSVSSPSVRCNFPDLEGPSIAVLGRPPDAKVLVRLRVVSGKVQVFLGLGSGNAYHERVFEGAGVTAFSAANGTQLDSVLRETTVPAGPTGDAATSIKGSIDCGDQTAGSSTVAFTGDIASGRLTKATLDPVRVECDPDHEIASSGLVSVGDGKALLSMELTSNGGVSVEETTPSGTHRYAADGTSQVTPVGGHVRADLVEEEAPSRRLHVEGDLTCGRHAAGA
jgi:hypothetical protein